MPRRALVPRRDPELRRARAAAPGPARTTTSWSSGGRRRAAPLDLTAARAPRRRSRAAGPASQRLGVGRGDRVAAYLPNIPETIVALLATASLGAIWSSCAPEFGVRAVIDRFGQIEPTVLLAVDGYRYGDKAIDRRAELAEIRAALPSLEATVVLPYLDPAAAAAIPDATAVGRPPRRRRRRSRSSRCRSTTRCTSSTRRARPGCRSRSSTATAASPSST